MQGWGSADNYRGDKILFIDLHLLALLFLLSAGVVNIKVGGGCHFIQREGKGRMEIWGLAVPSKLLTVCSCHFILL
jgi:hypothetical protein